MKFRNIGRSTFRRFKFRPPPVIACRVEQLKQIITSLSSPLLVILALRHVLDARHVTRLPSFFSSNRLSVFYRLNFPTHFLSAKLEKHELYRASICYRISIKNRLFKLLKGSYCLKWYFFHVSYKFQVIS